MVFDARPQRRRAQKLVPKAERKVAMGDHFLRSLMKPKPTHERIPGALKIVMVREPDSVD